MTAALDAPTRQIAFEQFVRAFARALWMTPAGWGVVLVMAAGAAPTAALSAWFAAVLACWLVCLALVRTVLKGGAAVERYSRVALVAPFIDGVGWGAVPLFLMGIDAALDARLAAVLCGVVAVTLGIYLTSPRAFQLQVFGTWCGLLAAWLLHERLHWSIPVGLAVMHCLALVLLPEITGRVLQGLQLQQANARLAEQLRVHLMAVEEEAATDPLTGVLNRRALDRLLARETERCESSGATTAVLALDLDHFKAINDAHGHAMGDAALRAFAERVRSQLRQSDHLARLGGEEFIVLLPGAPIAKAVEIAERLRVAVAEAPLVDVPRVAVTVSIGVAERVPGESGPGLLARADAAAYAAKRAGRDRVEAAAG